MPSDEPAPSHADFAAVRELTPEQTSTTEVPALAPNPPALATVQPAPAHARDLGSRSRPGRLLPPCLHMLPRSRRNPITNCTYLDLHFLRVATQAHNFSPVKQGRKRPAPGEPEVRVPKKTKATKAPATLLRDTFEYENSWRYAHFLSQGASHSRLTFLQRGIPSRAAHEVSQHHRSRCTSFGRRDQARPGSQKGSQPAFLELESALTSIHSHTRRCFQRRAQLLHCLPRSV